LADHLSNCHGVPLKSASSAKGKAKIATCHWRCGSTAEPHPTDLANMVKHISSVHLQHSKPIATNADPKPTPFCQRRQVVQTMGGTREVVYHDEKGVEKKVRVEMPVVYLVTESRSDLMRRHGWFQVVDWLLENWVKMSSG
jgi:hypothetical protein